MHFSRVETSHWFTFLSLFPSFLSVLFLFLFFNFLFFFLSLDFYLVPVHVPVDDDEKKKSGMNEQSEPEREEKKRMKRTRFREGEKSLLLCWSNKTCSESVCFERRERGRIFSPSFIESEAEERGGKEQKGVEGEKDEDGEKKRESSRMKSSIEPTTRTTRATKFSPSLETCSLLDSHSLSLFPLLSQQFSKVFSLSISSSHFSLSSI